MKLLKLDENSSDSYAGRDDFRENLDMLREQILLIFFSCFFFQEKFWSFLVTKEVLKI